jgi:hypothetical protein
MDGLMAILVLQEDERYAHLDGCNCDDCARISLAGCDDCARLSLAGTLDS